MKIYIYLFTIINLVLFSATVISATTLEGEVEGAFYRIEVPDNWNGDLVVWNHGLNRNDPKPLDFDDFGPLASLQYSQGYALAASSFRMNAWALFKSTRDNENLLNIFYQDVGSPNNIYMTGGSMGGLISEQYLEKGRVGHVAAAYALCPVLAGSRNWDGAFDLRLTYDAVCSEVPGAFIPGGSNGLPVDSTITEEELLGAVNACTGILFPAEFRSPEQQSRLDKITEVNRINEESLLENMAYALLGIQNMVYNPEKLNGRNGFWNYFVDYGDADINAIIERKFPDPRGWVRLKRNFTPKGHIDDAKLLALHTDKDDLVPVENLSVIKKRVPEDQLTTAVAIQDNNDHCGFTPAEFIAGWESVRTWIDAGEKPTAQSIQQNCQLLEAGGLAPGPCRIDPDYVIQDINTRIRPRVPGRSH